MLFVTDSVARGIRLSGQRWFWCYQEHSVIAWDWKPPENPSLVAPYRPFPSLLLLTHQPFIYTTQPLLMDRCVQGHRLTPPSPFLQRYYRCFCFAILRPFRRMSFTLLSYYPSLRVLIYFKHLVSCIYSFFSRLNKLYNLVDWKIVSKHMSVE